MLDKGLIIAWLNKVVQNIYKTHKHISLLIQLYNCIQLYGCIVFQVAIPRK